MACICRCAYARLLSLASTAVIEDSVCHKILARATGSPEPQPSTRTFSALVLEVDSPESGAMGLVCGAQPCWALSPPCYDWH